MQAKDIYFDCLDKHLPSIKAEGPAVPLACKQQRLQFEAACKSSWVSMLHFTLLQTVSLCPSSPAGMWAPPTALNALLQVKHFDALRDKRLQTLQKLQATISRTGQGAAGSIAGEQQKTSRA